MKEISLIRSSVVAVLFIVASTVLHAQSDYSQRGATSRLSVGLGLSPGIAIPTGDLDSTDETALGFAFRVGLNATYPFSRSIQGFLNAGIDIRNLGAKEDSSLDARFNSATYFYIEPGIGVSSLRLSLNIGLPMSGTEPDITPGSAIDATVDANDKLDILIEPRIGAYLVLIDEEMGWLGLTIDAGLSLNKLYKEEAQRTDVEELLGRNLIGSTSAITAHLGLTYQFAIPGTGGL